MKLLLIILLNLSGPDTTVKLIGTGANPDSLQKETKWTYNGSLCSGRLNFYSKEGPYINQIDRSCFFTKGTLDSICIYNIAYDAYFKINYITSEVNIKIKSKSRTIKRWDTFGRLLYWKEQKVVSRFDLSTYQDIKNIETDINYIDHGLVRSYWKENGKIQFSGCYYNGNRTGTWQYFYWDGKVECTRVYRRNRLVKTIGCDKNYKPALQYQTY